jgi:hypothetical protein
MASTNAPVPWIVWILHWTDRAAGTEDSEPIRACIVGCKKKGQSARDMVGRAMFLMPVRVQIPVGLPVTQTFRYFHVLPSIS